RMSVLRFRRLFALVLFALGAFSAGCVGRGAEMRRSADTASAGVARDDFGRAITLGKPPTRIVSLNPATTELLFALGAGARLVGRTQYDLGPDSARFVPNLGRGMRPNIEAVLGTHPDLVLLYASADDRPAADRLTAAGIPTAAFRNDRIADFPRVTLLIGEL